MGSWLARSNESIIRGLLAISALLLLIKTLYFARGFTSWGPLVRMVVTITEDMQPFLLIVLVFVSSFGIAFVIYNADTTQDHRRSRNESGNGDSGAGGDQDYDDDDYDEDPNRNEGKTPLDAINFVLNMAVCYYDHLLKTAF